MKTAVSMLGTAARATRSLGAILIDGGQLNPEDAERVLQYQKDHNLRFGEAAMRLGLISEADIQYALSRQFAYAYLRTKPVVCVKAGRTAEEATGLLSGLGVAPRSDRLDGAASSPVGG